MIRHYRTHDFRIAWQASFQMIGWLPIALSTGKEGTILFRGSPLHLITQARGKVWTITTQGERPVGELSIVSTIQMHNGTQYRVLGSPPADTNAISVEPSLEDGYIWMMQRQTDHV